MGDASSAWESWLRSWQRSLRARNLSPKTVSLYLSTGRELVSHLERTGGPDEPSQLRREHVEGLILARCRSAVGRRPGSAWCTARCSS